MTQRAINRSLATLTCLLLLSLPASAFELPEPDCTALSGWAGSLEQNQTFQPRPGIELNTLFHDDRIIPLFGEPVLNWQRENFQQLGTRLAACRSEMYSAGNRPAGEAIYAAMKTTRDAAKAMSNLWVAQDRVERQVGKLLEQEPSPELAGIFSMAQQALQGADVMDQVSKLSRRYQGLGRQVAQLSQYGPLLSQARIDAYVAQLEEKESGSQQQLAETKAEFDALLQQIAAVPLTQAGYAQLKRLSYNTDRSAMTRQELDSYNSAMQRKTNAIRQAMAAEQARAEAEAAQPIDLTRHLQSLMNGDEVDELSIAALHPDMPYPEAVAYAKDRLRLTESANPLDSVQFTVRREDGEKYNKERRTGPRVSLEDTSDGDVGQVIYEEFFRAKVIPRSAQQWLTEKLGEPDSTQAAYGGILMSWRDGGSRLQVLMTNSLEVVWKGAGYEGRLVAALWNRDYEKYLDKVNERCADIRDKPRNAWSMNDSQFFATECPMMAGAVKTPGLN